MTEEEFDNTDFHSNDEIEVRHYFSRKTEHVEWVNFDRREVNGYKPKEIIRLFKKQREINGKEKS